MHQQSKETVEENRFGFGENWSRFLSRLDENKIIEAENDLKEMLQEFDLNGKSFLDIGSGSGIHSLAAKRLGASVYSFDCDIKSVECTKELKRKYFDKSNEWNIEEGDVLDANYLNSLGKFDVVYSWGVLHHTGEMWKALDNVAPLVKSGGKLFVAVYNDQGGASNRWRTIKKLYNKLPKYGKMSLVLIVGIKMEIRPFISRLLGLKNPLPFEYWKKKYKDRGMTVWNDLVDWVGGYPFEVAKPEQIFNFYRDRNFSLKQLKTCGGSHGCNQFVFEKRE